ncbi:MAG TPA: pentapeptide repeat-containing protein [Ktedonobacteraceae bacterium]
MVQFFSHNGLSATFIGDALRGSAGLAGADLRQIELPQIQLAQANLSRVNFHEANLSEATLHRADLTGANLSQASLKKADLRGVNLRGANLSGDDLSDALMEKKKGGVTLPECKSKPAAIQPSEQTCRRPYSLMPACEKLISLALIWRGSLAGGAAIGHGG